jgi:hypothetical protein
MMDVLPISYRGRTVAACTRERYFLSDDLERRPPGDPELVFVTMLCAYAGDVLQGRVEGPYTEADARHYARMVLIPTELLERPELDDIHVAAGLGVPIDELRAARVEHALISH